VDLDDGVGRHPGGVAVAGVDGQQSQMKKEGMQGPVEAKVHEALLANNHRPCPGLVLRREFKKTWGRTEPVSTIISIKLF